MSDHLSKDLSEVKESASASDLLEERPEGSPFKSIASPAALETLGSMSVKFERPPKELKPPPLEIMAPMYDASCEPVSA